MYKLKDYKEILEKDSKDKNKGGGLGPNVNSEEWANANKKATAAKNFSEQVRSNLKKPKKTNDK